MIYIDVDGHSLSAEVAGVLVNKIDVNSHTYITIMLQKGGVAALTPEEASDLISALQVMLND